MTRLIACLALGLIASAAAAAAAAAGEMCPTGPSAISIVVVASKAQVRQYAASTRRESVAHYDEESLVLIDGRVVTSNIEAAGQRINDLGWSSAPIQVVGSLPKRARPRRSRG